MPEHMLEPSIFIVLIPLIIVFAVIVAIPYLADRQFKRSMRDRLAHEQPIVPFSSPEAAGKWTKGFLVAALILAVLAVISGALQIDLLSRMAGGSDYTMQEAIRNDFRQALIGILQALLYYGTAVPFLVWLHRMHRNLPSLGRTGLVFTPGWAVGFFFVPFLGLVRPFQAMREIWHGSDPGDLGLDVAPDGPEISKRLGTPPLVGWWWALFLSSNVVAGIGAQFLYLAPKTPPFSELRAASFILVVADLLLILSAVVAIRLVGRLTRWQSEKAESIRQRGGLSAEASAATPTSEAQSPIKNRPYVLIGLLGFGAIVMIGFALMVMFYFSPSGGPGAQNPEPSSYDTQDPASFSIPAADIDHPQAFDNDLMTFSYPAGWQIVETKGLGQSPGVQAQSPAGAFVRLRFDELQAGPESGIDNLSASTRKAYEGFTETGTFDKWGRLKGEGRLLSGRWEGALHKIRLFLAPASDGQALSVMEMLPVTDADEVEPGFELIRRTFQYSMNIPGLPAEEYLSPESLEKIKAEAARMNTGLVARVTRHSSGVTSYGATVEVRNTSTKTYDWVMVQVEFYDKAGAVVGTLKNEAHGGYTISPESMRLFAVTGAGRLDYETVRASVVYSVEVK